MEAPGRPRHGAQVPSGWLQATWTRLGLRAVLEWLLSGTHMAMLASLIAVPVLAAVLVSVLQSSEGGASALEWMGTQWEQKVSSSYGRMIKSFLGQLTKFGTIALSSSVGAWIHRKRQVRDLPCNIRREGGRSPAVGGPSLLL